MSELLQPQYAAEFQCTGPNCEDTCCRDWIIAVDKETYQHYQNCPDLLTRAQLEKYVSRNRSNPNDDYYAKIKLNSEHYCPMLDEEKMCSLQRKFGEKYLSLVCHTYPKNFRKVNGVWEMSLALSCPEAARSALLNPKRMEFDFASNPYTRFLSHPEFNSEDARFENKAESHFWPLRVFSISLMQNRNYPVWQRLVILGFFCHVVNNLQDPSEIPSAIERYSQAIEEGAFRDEVETIPIRYDLQGTLLNILVSGRLVGGFTTPKFVELFDKVKEAIGLGEPASQLSTKYQKAYETYYHPFMENREYILENYLVNYIFKNTFPFNNQGLFDSYVILVVHYAILKMLLIGLAAYYKEDFSEEKIIELIYSFSRNIEHDESYLQEVYKLFAENQLNNIPYMAILLRN